MSLLLFYIQELVSYTNIFKANSCFLFYWLQCGWIYVEVFETSGLEFSALGWIRIYLHSYTCQHQVIPTSLVEDTFFHCIILASLSKIRCSYVGSRDCLKFTCKIPAIPAQNSYSKTILSHSLTNHLSVLVASSYILN